jgi:hypothetical protein
MGKNGAFASLRGLDAFGKVRLAVCRSRCEGVRM